MSIYQPTWLYIKQHKLTGLKYFGKTTKNPYRYNGSGKYWVRHLKVHGNEVDTIWTQLFEDRLELMSYALTFSVENNIVESKEWANFIPENGLDGGVHGHSVSSETRNKISEALKGIPSPKNMTPEVSARYSNSNRLTWERIKELRIGSNHPMYGRKHSAESKLKNAESNRNRPRIECPHCGKSCQRSTYVRWHGDNCKLK